MEIWIRSQDKCDLVKVTGVAISIVFGTEIYIRGFTNYGGVLLGEYSTKEKAIKVIDMIQEEICSWKHDEIVSQCITREISPNITFEKYVFQMPQDFEVEV